MDDTRTTANDVIKVISIIYSCAKKIKRKSKEKQRKSKEKHRRSKEKQTEITGKASKINGKAWKSIENQRKKHRKSAETH